MSPFKKTAAEQRRRRDAAVSFAVSADMLTPFEIEQLEQGNMAIQGSSLLLNLNCAHPTLATGECLRLFHGRATHVMTNRLLGLPEDFGTKGKG
jgi:hypothetical protein